MYLIKWIFILVIMIFLFESNFMGSDQQGRFSFTGSEACRLCHGSDEIGNQYKIWVASPHSKAYQLLKSQKGIEIAHKSGISSPETAKDCLKCHTTGGGMSQQAATEGVGCEACHGPGSEYHKASNHVDYSSRENGYIRAIKYGMYPVLGIESLKYRERLCLSCHNNRRMCFPENLADDYKYRISIQSVDSLSKGGISFRHPLRR